MMSLVRSSYHALFIAAAAFFPFAASAAGVSVSLEQTSDLPVTAEWTLLKPDQDTVEGSSAKITIPELPAGQYTFFLTPPEGETAEIEFIRNDTLETTVPRPQISFTAVEGDVIKMQVRLKLTMFGTVGVNSEPAGIKFDLRGPNGMQKSGVTPSTFEKMPIGSYSVQYKPTGCPLPPGKSDVLKKDTSSYFSIVIQCDSLVTEEAEVKTHISTEGKQGEVMFSDVPVDAWFAAYVDTVASRGILTGYRDSTGNSTGEFGPENPVTVAELAKITHEMADVDEFRISTAPVNPGAIGKWFTKYIASAEERGWWLYQDPTLDLVRPATRGEVLVTLLQVLDIPMLWAKGKLFTDVSPRTPHAHAIETAFTEGIVSGVTDGNGNFTGEFRPDSPITRAEMAKILVTVHQKYFAVKMEE